MSSKFFRFLVIMLAWGSIYPITLAGVFLFAPDSRQELLWQLHFESHYVLAINLVNDFFSALQFTSIWLIAIFVSIFLRKAGYFKFAGGLLLFYPAILLAVIFVSGMPTIFWQMTITGWLLNIFFVGKQK